MMQLVRSVGRKRIQWSREPGLRLLEDWCPLNHERRLKVFTLAPSRFLCLGRCYLYGVTVWRLIRASCGLVGPGSPV